MNEYLMKLQDYRSQIVSRKKSVEEMIREWEALGCDCGSRPNAPCCLLTTELGLLTKLIDVLDRELWHLEHKND